MKIQELTLEHLKEFILENIFDNINFQLQEKHYRNLNIEELEEMFKFETEQRKRDIFSFVTFRIGLKLSDIEEISNYWIEKMFKDFIDTYNLENLKDYDVRIDFYSTQDYQFELELKLWSKKE